MFGLLRLFGGPEKENQEQPVMSKLDVPTLQQGYAPGTKIPYDPSLVRRLKEDHQKLLRLFTGMVKNVQGQQIAKAQSSLELLESSFNSHILLEFTKLYIFLESCLKSDPDNHATIREFRRKMSSVSRLVRAFFRKWRNDLTPSNSTAFLTHARQIGQLLFARMKAEEERLYEIYDMCPHWLMQQHKAQL